MDGPPSKIRIQTPEQKAFVLLQAAIGQHYLEDYTLRQEMSLVVEYATRILIAAEDYSVEQTKNGQVALECMLMRRRLATSLWSPSDGVLNQVGGVGQKTAAKLAMHKIRTFEDLLSKSSNEIEQACGRVSPFGQQLKAAASKILSRRLSVSAHIEGIDTECEDNFLICKLSLDEKFGEPENPKDNTVKYTLAAHTDRPGGGLIFRSGIIEPGGHRIACPKKFGRIYIRLVSNLVGLDSSLTLEGNDNVEISSFILTPVKGKESKKKSKKKMKMAVTSTSKAPSIMRHMVTGVEDLRIPKRKKSLANTPKYAVSTPSTSSISKHSAEKMTCSKLDNDRIVTPSPSTIDTSGRTAQSAYAKPRSRHWSEQKRTDPTNHTFGNDSVISRGPKRMRTKKGTWQRQKKEQKAFQQRAFGSPKENPFSAFKFDPNNCEEQLEQESHVNKHTETVFDSVIPPSFSASATKTPMVHAQRRSRFLSRGYTNTNKNTSQKSFFVGSARRNKSVSASFRTPNSQDLLRQKAEEQQTYNMVKMRSRGRLNDYSPAYDPNCKVKYTHTSFLPHEPIAEFIDCPTFNAVEPKFYSDQGYAQPLVHTQTQEEEMWMAATPQNFRIKEKPSQQFPSQHHHPTHFVNGNQPFHDYTQSFNAFNTDDVNGFQYTTDQRGELFHEQQPVYNQHLWEPNVEQNSFGTTFARPQGVLETNNVIETRPTMTQNLYSRHLSSQHGEIQENFDLPPQYGSSYGFQTNENEGGIEGNFCQESENPQGMIITVDGKEKIDARVCTDDTDFDNAFLR